MPGVEPTTRGRPEFLAAGPGLDRIAAANGCDRSDLGYPVGSACGVAWSTLTAIKAKAPSPAGTRDAGPSASPLHQNTAGMVHMAIRSSQ